MSLSVRPGILPAIRDHLHTYQDVHALINSKLVEKLYLRPSATIRTSVHMYSSELVMDEQVEYLPVA